ncbi:uncharacterized protein LOC117946082 [Etheostoma cragini]|uniref:uncharacterized protein LOC117946082 n=1 Tax=Etheostoma cragini TaxID=417921 RepID=UPI00155EE75D|nr:uncharacterized protein LOC117946082 [Etheostoma cragini]
MSLPLVVFLSAIVLHSVSAGGVYCAKTARARAAALGLNYPGVHGAPGLYGPPHHGLPPSTMPFRPQPYNNYQQFVRTESNMVPYRQSQPDVRSLYYKTPKQVHPRRWHRTHSPVQSDYTPNKVLGLPRGWSDSNRKYNFEVKHVAPLTQAQAPGQPELVNWPPKVHHKLRSFVHSEHDFGIDESLPNRRGMPQSRGHVAYQRGVTGYVLGRGAPALSSSGMINKGNLRPMKS